MSSPYSRSAAGTPHRWAAAVIALLAAVGEGLIIRIFVLGVGGQRVDQTAFDGSNLGRSRLLQVAHPVLEVVSVSFVVIVLMLTALIALLRRRWRLCLQVVIIMIGANLAAQVLKELLVRPELGVEGPMGTFPSLNTLPSGHTTVAASAAIAVLLVVPQRLRGLIGLLGAAYVAATGVSTLIGGWHRPSDVVAALLLTLVITGATLALLPVERPAWQGTRAVGGGGGWVMAIVLGAGGVIAAVLGAIALQRTWQRVAAEEAYSSIAGRNDLGHDALLQAYAGGALGVVAMTAIVLAAVMLLLPRDRT